MLRRISLCLLLAGASWLVTGCGQDQTVRSYTVPVDRQRMLAAIVRHGDDAWFFKLKGPAKDVAEVEKPVRTFLESVKFEGAAPAWRLPEDWTREEGGTRFATLKLPKDLEMTVHTFPVPKGMKWEEFELANVNRWRAELEQGELELVELPTETKSLAMSGSPALFLDVLGVAAPQLKTVEIPFGGGPMQRASDTAPAGEPADPATLPFTFAAPAEWQATAPGMMQSLRFVVAEGEEAARQEVEISVSPAMGNLLANINRWRGQVKLEAIGEEQLAKDVTQVTIDGKPAKVTRIVGPSETIQGAIVDAAGSTWFFKLKGDNALAEREQKRFDEFIKSVKFK